MFKCRVLPALIIFYPALASAEIIRVPVAQQGSDINHIARPARGASKTSVEQQFGEPQQHIAARGQPPVSSWKYADFTVYFEYEHVIHTVLVHRPANLTNPTAVSEQ